MNRLRAVAEHPRRMLGIVRVSKEKDGGVSPEIQVTAITDHCTRQGHDLVDIVEGLDQSGSQARSAWWPTLERAVAAVEAGEYDGIVVWKFSRVARHRMRWAVALDRVETAGGILESATEQFDTQTSAGRFARGMTAEMNAFYAEMIGESWKEAHERRIRSGRPASGKARFGYTYDPDQKLHVPDPVAGALLADMYRRYTAGESVYQLVRWLNGHGHKTAAGRLWSDRTLRAVLDSGFAAGTFAHRGVRHPGVHEPLITPGEWEAYQDARHFRRHRGARLERSEYLLSGMVRCARCGHPMVANTGPAKDPRDGPRYRCKTRQTKGPVACEGGYVQARLVEEHVLGWLRGKADMVEQRASELEVVSARKVSLEQEHARLVRELARVSEALTRLVVQNAEHPLPPAVYRAAATELEERAAGLEGSLEQVGRDRRRAVDDAPAIAAGLLEEWDELAIVQRRKILGDLIDCVVVATGRPRYRWMRVVEWHEVRS